MTKAEHNAASTWAGEIAERNDEPRPVVLWNLYWETTGHHIATIPAYCDESARRDAPWPYCKYPGKVTATKV